MEGLADMHTVLRRAGYRLDDAHALHMGTMAFQMAAVVQISLLDTPARSRHKRVGRNDPCPCGSGRKYKKCCLKRGLKAPAAPGGPVPDPALVPNLVDMDAVLRDMRTLADLFESDPELKRLRFERRAVTRHVEAALDAGPPPAGREGEWLDEVAWRFVRQDDQAAELVSGLRETFMRVAARHGGDTDALRSLVQGSLFALSFDREDEDPEPLACMIFKLSMSEQLLAAAEVDRLVERMGGSDEAARARLLARDPEVTEALRQAAGAMNPEAEAALRATFDDELDELFDSLRAGSFPVLLPMISILPVVADLPIMEGQVGAEEVKGAFIRALDGWDPEDTRLYGEVLDAWIASSDDADPRVYRRVTFVRGLVAAGDIEPVAAELLVSSVSSGVSSVMDGEEALLADPDLDPLSAAYLERYAELLDRKGYPSLARRARQAADQGLLNRWAAQGSGEGDEGRKGEKKARKPSQLDLF